MPTIYEEDQAHWKRAGEMTLEFEAPQGLPLRRLQQSRSKDEADLAAFNQLLEQCMKVGAVLKMQPRGTFADTGHGPIWLGVCGIHLAHSDVFTAPDPAKDRDFVCEAWYADELCIEDTLSYAASLADWLKAPKFGKFEDERRGEQIVLFQIITSIPLGMCDDEDVDDTKLAAALADMRQRISDGGEYPDVEWACAKKHGVSSDDLRAAYDTGE